MQQQTHAELVEGKPEEELKLAVGAEPRSRTTPAKEMGPVSQAGALEEEDFSTGPEHPNHRTGPHRK